MKISTHIVLIIVIIALGSHLTTFAHPSGSTPADVASASAPSKFAELDPAKIRVIPGKLPVTGATSWTSGGPWGGYVNCLAMAKTNPNIIYAGTEGGVFKTVNAGGTWNKTGFATTRVRSIVVAADNANLLYAGTDDGVYESQDEGNTWVQKGLGGARVNALAIHPQNNLIVLAATGRPLASYSGEIIGIFKTTDGGLNWQSKLSAGLDAVSTLLFDADDPSYVYAGVYTTSSGPGLRKSADTGDTWVNRQVSSVNWDDVVALAMTPPGTSPAAVYAIVGGQSYVFKSINRGDTWTPASVPWISPSPPWALAVDPHNPSVIYAGTLYYNGGLYKSPDEGATWSSKASGLPTSSSFSNLAIDPRNGVIYLGLLKGGLYKSSDGAENWSLSMQGLANANITALAIQPGSSNSLMAGLANQYLAHTDNQGATWDFLTKFNAGAVGFDPHNPAQAYEGDGWDYYNFSLQINGSATGGQNWATLLKIYYGGSFAGATDIWVSPNDSNLILAAVAGEQGGVYRSINGGTSWNRTYQFWANALATDPGNSQILYFGSSRCGYVFQSTSSGSSWSNISPSAPPGECWVWEVRDVEVGPDSHVYAATDIGLMKRDGDTWTKISGLPTDNVTALAVDRTVSPWAIYAGTGGQGIFVSQDAGSTWTPCNEGLGRMVITRLAISSSSPTILYAGTEYGGVWSRDVTRGTFMDKRLYLPLIIRDNTPGL